MTVQAQDFHRQVLHHGWTLRATDPPHAQAIHAQVPGTVQLQLIEDGLLPDPYYGTNEQLVQWVGETGWTYSLKFDVSNYDEKRHYQLSFQGLDTYAEVILNGEMILQADNMFRRWSVKLGDQLKANDNLLTIHFRPPAEVVAPLLHQRPPYEKTAANDTSEPKMANFIRKAQFHFGWDWGLRLASIGIWRPVYLESWAQARIQDVQLYQRNLNDARAKVGIAINLDRHLSRDTYELRVRDGANGKYYRRDTIHALTSELIAEIDIENPHRWWPSGHGEPARYEIVCELYHEGQLLDTFSRHIGLRTVELVQEEDSYGTSFYFRINGRPIFIKGASYIPQDALLNRVTVEQKTELLTQAHDAHMNLIRVWGGGIYEDETFYNTCDSLGLMVWQDFMFACAAYPGHESFTNSIMAEVRDNVRRLRNHPSIITWCGNNEVFLAMKNWGWQDKFNITSVEEAQMDAVYAGIFQDIIPAILAEEDPDRPYTHTTPTSEWHTQKGLREGTLHYWGVWHGPDDFSGYESKVGRYMNEYGFQSFPDMTTIASFADSSQWALDSPVMDHHQKSYVGNGLIGKFTKQYGEPASTFPEFVHQSQRVQYEGIRRAIIAHRLHWGYCMGTTFWQLNDCWPGPSWSAIDYYGRPKVLFQELPNLYAPVIAAAVGKSSAPQLAIISDEPNPLDIVIEWERKNATGISIHEGQSRLSLQQPGTVLLSYSADMTPHTDEQTTIIIKDSSGQLISTFYWDGRQVPIQLPQHTKWQSFPSLVMGQK